MNFFRKTIILGCLVSVLALSGYGTYVYAEKYTWTRYTDIATDWQAVALTDDDIGYAGKRNILYRNTAVSSSNSWVSLYDFGTNNLIRSIATSENGNMIYVVTNTIGSNNSIVSISTDAGVSFTDQNFNGVTFSGATSDKSGQYVYFSATDSNRVYRSSDSGTTLETVDIFGPSYAVTTSGDGLYVYVAAGNNLMRSGDYGGSFSGGGGLPSATYIDIDTSRSGQYIYAVPTSGQIVFSEDYGATYSILDAVERKDWKSVSVSDDGTIVVAVTTTGALYTSRDSGATFTVETSVGSSVWNDIAVSSNGSQSLLASSDAYLWTGRLDTTPVSITNIDSSAPDGTYTTGQQIQITATTSEPVYGTSIVLTLETGVTDRNCTITFATGATSGTCTYTVQSGDSTSKLQIASISGAMYDDAGNYTTDFEGWGNFLGTNTNIAIDTVGPAVSIISPATMSTVSGAVSISASAVDAVSTVAGVQFKVQNTNIGAEDTSSPYAVSWDTTALADGTYTVYAVARDSIGKYSTSSISVIISNPTPDPDPEPETPGPTSPSSGSSVTTSGPTAYSVPTTGIALNTNTIQKNTNNTVGSNTDGVRTAIEQAQQKMSNANIPEGFRFTKNATVGTMNSEVLHLQKMLNLLGYTVSPSGFGSKENETMFFGKKTKAALMKFQKAFAIPQTGFFGVLSKAAMNSILRSIEY